MSQTKAQLLDPQGDLTLNGTLIGVGATFSGNVSIAGTLTKQDVTNVDSVGLITARSGINVTGGGINVSAGVGTFGGNLNIADYIKHTGDLDTWIGFPSADTFKVETNGAERLRITSDGKYYFTGTGAGSASRGLEIDTESVGAADEGVILNARASGTTGRIKFQTNSATAMTILGNGGNIGIGTEVPSNALDVQAGTTNTAIVARSTDAKAQISLVDNTTTSVGSVVIGAEGDALFLSSGSAGDERLRIGTSGQLGIAGANYGNAGQVITSGGSGSAISWADAASGAEYSGIASGSIAAGDSVIVHPDGKLSKVEYSYTAKNPVGMGTQQSAVAGTNISNSNNTARQKIQSLNVGVGQTFPKVFNFWMDESNQRGYIRMGEVRGNNLIDWGSTTTYMGTNTDIVSQAAWDPINKIGFMVYQDNSGCSGWAFREHPDQPNNIQLRGGEINLSGSGANMPGVTYDSVEGKFLVVIGYDAQHEGGDASARVLSLDSNGTASWGTRITWHSGRVMYPYLAYSPTLERHYASWRRQGGDGSNDHYGTVFSISGTNVTAGSNIQVSSDDYDGGFTSWDSNAGKFINVYLNGTDNTMRARAVTVSGMTPSFGAQSSVLTATNASGNNYFTISTTYDPILKNVFAVFRDNYLGAYRKLTVSGTDIVLGTHGYIESGRTVDNMSVTYVAGVDKIAVAYQALYSAFSGGPNDTVTKIIDTSDRTTNLTTDNFVGLSKAAYSDGNTAKVLTSGAIDESVSGLTPGERYFVKGDGSLSTSPDEKVSTYAGQAVAANRIVVKDGWNVAQPGILGFWEYSITGTSLKPWCQCGFIGAYDCFNGGSASSCSGCFCEYCRYGGNHQQQLYSPGKMADVATGKHICYCCACGGSQPTQCCCFTNSYPCATGKFYFPSPGLYCYDFNASMCWGSYQTNGGCFRILTFYQGRYCQNNNCNTWFAPINGWSGDMNYCSYGICQAFQNPRMSGTVSIVDVDTNYMAFKMCYTGMCGNQACQNGLNFNTSSAFGCWTSKVKFTKINNDPGMWYCN